MAGVTGVTYRNDANGLDLQTNSNADIGPKDFFGPLTNPDLPSENANAAQIRGGAAEAYQERLGSRDLSKRSDPGHPSRDATRQVA